MPTVLITGANRGLGLEFARQYAADGWRVVATCRDPAGAGELAGLGGDVQCHALDITDHARITALAGQLEDQAIDVLLNNAGIHGPRQDHPMDGPNALIDAAESVTGMRRVIAGLEPAATGCFFSYDGAAIPW